MIYAVNKVHVDGHAIGFENDLEKAKNIWASMYIEVFEITEEQKNYLLNTYTKTDIDKVEQYLKDNCNLVYDGK